MRQIIIGVLLILFLAGICSAAFIGGSGIRTEGTIFIGKSITGVPGEAGTPPLPIDDDALLLESGDYLLLESGDKLLLE